jgi:hypothetical protein
MPRICKGPPPERPGDGPIKASCLAADACEIAQNHLQRQAKIPRNPVAVDATAAAVEPSSEFGGRHERSRLCA